MEIRIAIFAIFFGFLFSIITPAESIIPPYGCKDSAGTNLPDNPVCVSCDTIATCAGGVATITEKCEIGKYCEAGACSDTPPGDCATSSICPNGATTGCYPDPISTDGNGDRHGFVDCSGPSFVLCADDAATGKINVDASASPPVCGCSQQTVTVEDRCDGLISGSAAKCNGDPYFTYFPPGIPYECAYEYYSCYSESLYKTKCATDGQCYDGATCECIDLITTTTTTVAPEPICPSCGRYPVPDTNNTGYQGCIPGAPISVTVGVAEYCEEGVYLPEPDKCKCGCPNGCDKAPTNVPGAPCNEYTVCSTDANGHTEFASLTCLGSNECFNQTYCGCLVVEITTTLDPDATTLSNCAEYDDLCFPFSIRPNDANSSTYFTCVPGADDVEEKCPPGYLFLINACQCVPCDVEFNPMPGETSSCETEFYYCDSSSGAITYSNCKNSNECVDFSQEKCVVSTAPTLPTTVEGGGNECPIGCGEKVDPDDEHCYINCQFPSQRACCPDGKIYSEASCLCEDGPTTTPDPNMTTESTSSTASDPSSSSTSDPTSSTTSDPPVGPTPPPGMTTTCGAPDRPITCDYGEVTSTTNHSDYVNCDDFTRIFYCSVGNEFLYKCCRCGGACTKNVELYHLDFDD